MAAPGVLLSARNLGILRGERVVLSDTSVDVHAGEAIILLGANGAGKTTLLRILAGLTQAETGSVELSAPFHWLGHRDGLKPHETPYSHLMHWAKAWGAPNSPITNIIERLGLTRPMDVPARHLSAGQRRRTAIGRLLLEPRALWLLDEPFTALDTDGQDLLRSLITAHRANGGAIVTAIHGDAGLETSKEMVL